MEELDTFMESRNLPSALRGQITDYYKVKYPAKKCSMKSRSSLKSNQPRWRWALFYTWYAWCLKLFYWKVFDEVALICKWCSARMRCPWMSVSNTVLSTWNIRHFRLMVSNIRYLIDIFTVHILSHTLMVRWRAFCSTCSRKRQLVTGFDILNDNEADFWECLPVEKRGFERAFCSTCRNSWNVSSRSEYLYSKSLELTIENTYHLVSNLHLFNM